MLASLLSQLETVGIVVGLAVIALVVFGGMRMGGSGKDSARERRGDAFMDGEGDD